MPETRSEKMNLRLSMAEKAVREALELHLGTDGAGVMRQGLLDLGRKHGIHIEALKPETKKKKPGNHH